MVHVVFLSPTELFTCFYEHSLLFFSGLHCICHFEFEL